MDRSKILYKKAHHDQFDWLDPDQELYHRGDDSSTPRLRESLSLGFRSLLAVVICIIVPAYLFFGLPGATFSGDTAGFARGEITGPKFRIVMPEPPPGELFSERNQNMAGMSIVDYAAELDRLGFLEALSGPAVQAFYGKGVQIDYLGRLAAADMLNDLSFPAVVAFYESEVPVDYLEQIEDAGLLEDLSFPAVISFYKEKITIDYLQQLKEPGYLEEFSFPAVTAFYREGVTVDFLDELNGKGLLTKLSFPDIVGMYKSL